jgi:hypothetical protein
VQPEQCDDAKANVEPTKSRMVDLVDDADAEDDLQHRGDNDEQAGAPAAAVKASHELLLSANGV